MPIEIRDTRNDLPLEEKKQILETFELLRKHPQIIRIETKEFSAVCPGTGLPDIGHLIIEYVPNNLCVELKSLKMYLFSFRQEHIFQEPVTEIIFDHLWEVLNPFYLKVWMKYNTRGGMDTVTQIVKGDLSQFENYSFGLK